MQLGGVSKRTRKVEWWEMSKNIQGKRERSKEEQRRTLLLLPTTDEAEDERGGNLHPSPTSLI